MGPLKSRSTRRRRRRRRRKNTRKYAWVLCRCVRAASAEAGSKCGAGKRSAVVSVVIRASDGLSKERRRRKPRITTLDATIGAVEEGRMAGKNESETGAGGWWSWSRRCSHLFSLSPRSALLVQTCENVRWLLVSWLANQEREDRLSGPSH